MTEKKFANTTRWLPVIENKVSSFLSRQDFIQGDALAKMTAYHFETGGKRLRALIPIYFFECFRLDGAEILPFACCVEMIHNATLVHDDLQDGDEFRRGRATVWKKFGMPQAVNCGDAMFQYPFLLLNEMSEASQSNALKWQLAIDGVTATLRVIEGQAQEFLMKEEAFPGIERYLGVVRGKTSYLFAHAIMGALKAVEQRLSVNLPLDLIESHVLNLGALFQIQDDVLDVYADKGRDRRATDIAEGKVSVLVAYAYEKGTSAQKNSIRTVLNKGRQSVSDADIDRVIEIFDEIGAKEFALNHIDSIIRGIAGDSRMQKEAPVVREALLELADVFLKPISNLTTGK